MELPLPLVDNPAGGFADGCALPPTAAGKAVPFFIAAPEQLHPALWRADQLGAGRAAVTASGFAALDAELPGGGWPHRALTELLLPHPGLGEMRLLAPALAAVAGQAARAAAPAMDSAGNAGRAGRCVMLFDPPAAPCGWALAQLGVDVRQLLVVHGREAQGRSPGRSPADLLWALEQSLKSGHVGAVLAWLPARLRADALRRLQLAAQVHDGPVFVLRDIEARLKPSAAPLRLALQAGAIDEIALHLLKRRGPPLAQALRLALPPVLTARLRERALARQAVLQAASPGRVGAVADA